jgi:threonylcarbamoyladenosine tRNA methylthiotransferase MtaB
MTTGNEPVVTFHTLGCKLNQAETELLADRFTEAGFRVASNGSADVCILNTCTVTHIADRKSRHLVRLLRKKNPKALIVATGCYAERAPPELTSIGVDLVIGNEHKMNMPELVKRSLGFKPGYAVKESDLSSSLRVRSFVKIQDGCSDFCAYCVVPLVRGRESCLSVEDVIATVKAKVSAGYKEIILTGTKIGTYNYDGIDLKQMIKRILGETDVMRLHLSSLQPREISEDLLGLWQDSRLCRHFHVALQSGSNAVLKRMRRHYSLSGYKKAVSMIRQAVADVAVTTDIMVGFPAESDEEFEESYHFCQDTGFADIHVFSYSSRPGTAAAEMVGQVDERLKKERSLRMLALAKESAGSFQKQFLGQVMAVLWESAVNRVTGLYSGLSDNYIRVFTQSRQQLSNCILPARLVRSYREGLWGEIVL